MDIHNLVYGSSMEKDPVLLFVETIHVFDTSNNIFSLMLKCLDEFGGLSLEEWGGKLVSVGCDGNNVF